MWQAGVACLALLVLPVTGKDLEPREELPQEQEPDLNYDDYNPFGEDENGKNLYSFSLISLEFCGVKEFNNRDIIYHFCVLIFLFFFNKK